MKTKHKIKDANDFLGFIISIKNKENLCNIEKILNGSGLSNLMCSTYISELSSKKYVKQIDTCTLFILPSGLSAYISPARKFRLQFLNTSKLLLKFLIPYLLGLFSDDIYKIIVSFFNR